MLLKIIILLVIWAIAWGACMGELYLMEKDNFDINDSTILFAFIFAPMAFIGYSVFMLIYKLSKNKEN